MPNVEIRKKLEDRNPKTVGLVFVAEHCFETGAKTEVLVVWSDLRISGFFRFSDFGLRIFVQRNSLRKSFYPQ